MEPLPVHSLTIIQPSVGLMKVPETMFWLEQVVGPNLPWQVKYVNRGRPCRVQVSPPSEVMSSHGVFGSRIQPLEASMKWGRTLEQQACSARVFMVHVAPASRVTRS